MKKFYLSLLIILSLTAIYGDMSSETIFTEIYQKGHWGAVDFSGGGSSIEKSGEYIQFIEKFIKEHSIKSVIDIGCGDWQFSRFIDWEGIEYTGYDVVRHLIEKNQREFGTGSIVFIQGDALEIELPSADLLLCKDVLQHLTNQQIHQFLKKLPKFKHVLITNDISRYTIPMKNKDLKKGEFPPYRPLDLTLLPFSIHGEKIFKYESDNLKEVLYIKNE